MKAQRPEYRVFEAADDSGDRVSPAHAPLLFAEAKRRALMRRLSELPADVGLVRVEFARHGVTHLWMMSREPRARWYPVMSIHQQPARSASGHFQWRVVSRMSRRTFHGPGALEFIRRITAVPEVIQDDSHELAAMVFRSPPTVKV